MPNPYLEAFNDPYYKGESARNVDKSFDPFRRYLEKAQASLEKKEVSCKWAALSNSRFMLELDRSVFEIQPFTEVKFKLEDPGWFEIIKDLDDGQPLTSDFEADFSSPLTIGKGKNHKNISIDKKCYKTEGNCFYIFLGNEIDTSIEKLSWAGYSLSIKSLGISLEDEVTLFQSGQEYTAKRINGNRFTVEGTISDAPILVRTMDTKQQVNFSAQSLLTDMNGILELHSKLYKVSNKTPKNKNSKSIKINQDLLEHLSIADLRNESGEYLSTSWELEYKDGGLYLDTKGGDLPDKIVYFEFGIELKEKVRKNNDKWIQLLPLGSDEESGKDSLDYFFDDNVDVLDLGERPGRTSGYRILKSNREERQVMLCRKGDKSKKSVLPSKPKLEVNVNTQGIWQQREAITKLKLAPSLDQKPLLNLVNTSGDEIWPSFKPKGADAITWRILGDIDFDGCDKQREFVCKALNTPDYAILDGPPGTGKTTTILELIIQLAREGKRVLLTASTHAAINNVLERVISNSLEGEIFPLRVGDEGNAVGVEKFQYDNLLDETTESLDITKCNQLMVDSSNLVCGTTMGINRLFNDKEISFTPGYASFDYMIIDECSKTTFTEFLVPARYAKRWVLVGDVKQLSPFTDRDQITSNLKELSYFSKEKKKSLTLSSSIQRACFLLSELRSKVNNDWGYHDKIIFPVSPSVLRSLKQEMEATPLHKKRSFGDICLVGELSVSESINVYGRTELQLSPWKLYNFNLLFIESSLCEEFTDYLPADAILLSEDWMKSAHHHRHKANHDGAHSFRQGTNVYYESHQIHRYWKGYDKDSKWADQLVWRLENEYWLRFSKQGGSKGHSSLDKMRDQIRNYLPKSIDISHEVYRIRDMAFPSILEALSGSGITGKGKGARHTLNNGFSQHEKDCRHSTLTYQHRMHPDISKYPRKAFYSNGDDAVSLLDGKQTRINREWSYSRYPKHAIWLDIDGTTQQNSNEKEANRIIEELKDFVAWADSQAVEFDVAILTFYKKQEALIRKKLQTLSGQKNTYARFKVGKTAIKLNTVDYFQGQEADLVFLSMVNTNRDGFLSSPNRLNVAITRARYQLVICGRYAHFNQSNSNELRNLSHSTLRVGE